MPDTLRFLLYLGIMAGVTYLIRVLPLLLVKGKIENRYIRSFLYYVPYAVLAAMTVPAVFYATESLPSALCGFAVALVLAYLGKSLLLVASSACAAVFAAELLLAWLPL